MPRPVITAEDIVRAVAKRENLDLFAARGDGDLVCALCEAAWPAHAQSCPWLLARAWVWEREPSG